MNRLLFIKNIEQWAAVRDTRPDLVQSCVVIALTTPVWLMLHQEGCEARAAVEFLSATDLETTVSEGRQLSRSWLESVSDQLVYRDIDLADLIRLDMLTFCRTVVAAELVAKALVQELRPTQAFLFAQGQVPCLRWHRTAGTHDVCEQILAYELAKAGVRVENLAHPPNARLPWIPLALKKALRRMLGLSGKVSVHATGVSAPNAEQSSFLTFFARQPGSRQLLAIGEEVDLLTLAALVEVLDTISDWQTRLVSTTKQLPNMVGRSGISSVANAKVFLLPQLNVPSNPRFEQSLQRARKAFGKSRPSQLREHPALADRGLRFHIDAVWKYLGQEVVPHIDRVHRLLRDVHPDGVMVAGVEMAKDRATVRIARQLGIKTLGIPHGFLGNVDAYDFETDLFLAWGEAPRQCLIEELGKNPEAIRTFGPIHLNRLSRSQSEQVSHNRKRLLVVTSRHAEQCSDALLPITFVETWKALLDYVRDNKDVELWVKPHPRGDDPIAWYERLCNRLPSDRVRFVTSSRLEELAHEVDAAIAMIDISTAFLVLQKLQIPTVFVRPGWRMTSWAYRAWGLPNGLVSVESLAEVAPTVHRLLFDKAFREHCRGRGESMLAANLQPHGALGPRGELESILNALIDRGSENPIGAGARAKTLSNVASSANQ